MSATLDSARCAGPVIAGMSLQNAGQTAALDEPRILFVNHASQIAGAEMVLLDIAGGRGPGSSVFLFEPGAMRAALQAAGAGVSLSRRAGSLAGVKRDRSLLRALPMAARMIGTAMEIASAARDHDLIYANSQKAFVLSAMAARLARRKLIWHLHDIISPAHFGRWQRRLVVFLANRCATRIIVPSKAAADAFIEAGGNAASVRVVPNGLNVVPSLDGVTMRSHARARAGLPDGFLTGVFSRIAPWKGQHIALQALASIPDMKLVIVGDALFGEDAFAARLREDAVRLGIADRVLFLGHRPDVAALMRLVDVVIHPSVSAEPFGRTLVEAMLCRTPLIASDAGAVGEILDQGRAGILVPPADAAALAAALRALRSDPEGARTRIDIAERRARYFYNACRMRAGIDSIIAEVRASAEARRQR